MASESQRSSIAGWKNSLRNPSLVIGDAFIDGNWVHRDNTFPVYVPRPHRRSFMNRQRGLNGVRSILRAWFDHIQQNVDDLATILSYENGKTYAEAKGEVEYAASFVRWFAEEASRMYGDTIPSQQQNTVVMTIKQPVGVCGIITPWNFPAAMVTRKVAPALAAGCAVVIKPPSETPHTCIVLVKLAVESGVPGKCIQVCPTKDRLATLELATNPKVAKISFTGSTGVSKMLAELATKTLKKVSLELGGNAPFIVFDDADIDIAVEGAMINTILCNWLSQSPAPTVF
ncbi:Aldehyde/histidinol dehydrogenase [Aspergillus keveii]|uniref:Aldehyde/histidinol dehydrogenase n=1 Tax=Aspergillus keveii TaxID=714993 RepID=A0ABR4FQ26_9EURO